MRIGGIRFWARGPKILSLCRLSNPNVCLTLDPDIIAKILKESKPVIMDFTNNTEALATKNSFFIRSSLSAIAQESFKGQPKKAITIIEPYLTHTDKDVKHTAADALLEFVPDHKEARRLRDERRGKKGPAQ